MTRINVIPVEELSDKWLLAEYRELPRCIKQDVNTDNAPRNYRLGTGHVKWAKNHTVFLVNRFSELVSEMKFRGFSPVYDPKELADLAWNTTLKTDYNDYTVGNVDIAINRKRLTIRYLSNPMIHKWTNRIKPEWLQCQ